ncbi:assimilatory sulfite reductase (NADPH) flavoprotein subunit [Novilysobacter spongiicola]|uniref:Sulfite reductase [NADPH] flavoprotein alpha-component n=1 Tax=Lysobacter spongiicola DSM 21749 TaxID=1122188 RepID=A0A1T4P798_9GAMM|nr:assimilatory sulfite reductase (NADPH) flavoprotein subunit [Lysobacter spongiicola]SJZ87207.1 sulfite reductase (NADPH) flavoprotein alpha-component [Lysobacter spongiicola DSM 21749]
MSATAPAAPPAPLPPDKTELLQRLTEGLDANGLWWLSGYAAGRASGIAAPLPGTDAPPSQQAQPATVVYGSQTGNAKRIGEALARKLEADGVPARLLRADRYPTRELKDERQMFLVFSTQGDGEPSDDARALVEFILGKRAPKLPGLHFAVLGLGDSSYPEFCAIGRQLDERLESLGATRMFARADADLDIETVSDPWLQQANAAARESLPARPPRATVTTLHPAPPAFGRDRPFPSPVLANLPLTAPAGPRHRSDRDIRHLELSLEGSGLSYEPGDALGVWPENPPALVEAVLDTLSLDGDSVVGHGGTELPLHQWLSRKLELTRLTRPFLARHAELSGSEALQNLLQPAGASGLSTLLATHQTIDLLQAHPAHWTPEALVAALRPLAPRLYSIASSQKEVGEEAHLTVAHVDYRLEGQQRWGAASHFLAGRSDEGAVPVYIEANERFRLPADPARDIVMIGPGTGVAPFRGFLQDRTATGASGRNWLVFGNPHLRTDFLYQTEWQQALRDGRLDRLDLAFSRDQAEKVYVQQRLLEQGRRLHEWIEGGAHVYVCGDASRMARDVHEALTVAIATHGGLSREDAAARLEEMQQQGRYARDVY